MPILTPTEIRGETVWLGLNRDRARTLESEAVERVEVDYGGFVGESHGGLTRPSCSRVKLQYPKGTEIKNARQVTILSAEELEEVSAAMGLPEPDAGSLCVGDAPNGGVVLGQRSLLLGQLLLDLGRNRGRQQGLNLLAAGQRQHEKSYL